MSVAKVSITDLQFGDDDPRAKLRRLVEEIRRLQQTVNALIEQTTQNDSTGVPNLAIGEWAARVVDGSPPTFVVTYNDGGTIRTGSMTLS